MVMHVVTYRVKDIGRDANYYRDKAKQLIGSDAYVEVHPGLVRFRFTRELSESELEELDDFIKEVADGVRQH
ncbi:MAG: hypothetical protein DRO12_02440 [Thermoprotei archaeon]|nr:MAG: hypothetical protein DRO12_02440 [Thermoprotei archaeon]